jgi:carbonic anhydrase
MTGYADRRAALLAIGSIGLCTFCAKLGFAAETVHWRYEGERGPDHWGGLDAANRVCGTGSQQSPVAIAGSVPAELPPLQFEWTEAPDTIVNNGHSIQLNFSGRGGLKVGPDHYRLVQFHLHHPSEHLIDDKASAMEVHFVHSDDAGRLAVVGVLVQPGRPNPTFARIIAAMPVAGASAVKAPAAIGPLDLLPRAHGYYRYEGSLTTPPCSETVEWLLLRQPLEVAAVDIEAFARLYPMNARPVQKIDRRFVLRSL